MTERCDDSRRRDALVCAVEERRKNILRGASGSGSAGFFFLSSTLNTACDPWVEISMRTYNEHTSPNLGVNDIAPILVQEICGENSCIPLNSYNHGTGAPRLSTQR